MFQNSCSELLVDTAIHSSKDAFEKFSHIAELFGWKFSPVLTVELLEALKADDNHENGGGMSIEVYDADENKAYIEYGSNGYIHTGFRFDSQCCHCDTRCFSFFEAAIEKLNGKLIACDGGSTYCYEEWKEEKDNK